MTTQTAALGTETTLGTYTIDASHSQAGFQVRHLAFSKVRGRFATFAGEVHVDPSDLRTLRANATLDAASIQTGDEKRDAHLRSEDFFEVETYPELTFVSTGVESVSGETLKLAGDLTIHGVTRRVVLGVAFLGEAQDPWGGQRVAFEASVTINRKDFGLTWNAALETGGVLVSEDVAITLEIQAVRQ